MTDNTLMQESQRLTQAILSVRDKQQQEFRATEDRLRAVEQELQQMEKTDLRENAPYQLAKDEQARLNAILTLLDKKIKSIESETGEYTPTNSITIGTTVDLHILDIDGERPNVSRTRYVVKIVKHETSSAKLGLIAEDGKVGSAIMGRKAGDIVQVLTIKGLVKYKIERIY